ncbi:MAG TPA: calcium/proton exchanger [Gemmataceae bacterium]|nr:calcium/proton exchanger [Gemmataceae bacterium]
MIFVYLLLLVPLSLALAYIFHAPPIWIFVTAVLAIVPLAEWLRRATDQMAKLAGPAIGGLLNVTFGNMAELLLGLFVLASGQAEVVKGQITGAIIGNGLLGLGLAIVVGTWGRDKGTFHKGRAGLLSSLLILSVIALLTPGLFHYTERGAADSQAVPLLEERLSLGVSVVLIGIYIANLIYTLITHRNVFAMEHEEGAQADWSLVKALGVLLGATVLTAIEAELVAGALEATGERLGLSSFFLGIIVLAVVGNAAEYAAAVYFARGGNLSLSLEVTLGSAIQVALLVAPLLVLVSYFMGHPMNLVFANPLEMIAIAAVAFIVNAIAHDGEATWFEGLLLLAVYVILGLAFYYVSP